MKRKLWIILALAALMAALCCGAAMADGSCGENVTWSLQPRTGVLTISGTGPTYNYGLSRTNLPPFYNVRSSIRSIVIQDGVTGVGEYLFVDAANVTSVTLPASVEGIGTYAFYRCTALRSVTVNNPNAVIGASAFANCSASLQLRGWDPSTTKTYAEANGISFEPLGSMGQCGDNVYYTLNLMTGELTITGTGLMWDYSTSSNVSPFNHNAQILTATIGEGVTSVGECALASCANLVSVTIPSTVTVIENDAFINCVSLNSVTISDGVTDIRYRAFYGCESLTSISLPNSVTRIGEQVFYHCGLTSITLPDKLTSISYQLFYDCQDLTSVTIPNSVKSIDRSVFDRCFSLTNVTIPVSVTSIGSFAFSRCTSLTSVTVYNPYATFGESVFHLCPDNLKLRGWYPSKTKTYADENGIGFESLGVVSGSCGPFAIFGFDPASGYLVISGSGSIIGAPWESYKEWVKTVKITDYITEIGNNYIFKGCANLTSVTIESNVTRIGTCAFENCTALTDITLPDSLTSIGTGAFYNCASLNSINIPEGVTEIGNNAFERCGNLTEITIPYSVNSIGFFAFCECTSLKRVTFLGPATVIGNSSHDVFTLVAADFTIYGYLGSSAQTYANAAGHNFVAITAAMSAPDFVIPPNTLRIEEEAFSGAKMSVVYIPDSVTFLGSRAFENCMNLKEIRIPDSITEIPFSVFTGVPKSQLIIFGKPGSAAQTFANSEGIRFIAE